MTPTEREMLELIAKACGYELNECTCRVKMKAVTHKPYATHWNPLEDDGDCARMCADLCLSSSFSNFTAVVHKSPENHVLAFYSDHGNSRLAAWRYACCRVAAEIGRGINPPTPTTQTA